MIDMETRAIRDHLRECLSAHPIPGITVATLASDGQTSLSSVDSMGLMELSMLLEVEYGIEVAPHELEHVSSMDQLAGLIQTKIKSAG